MTRVGGGGQEPGRRARLRAACKDELPVVSRVLTSGFGFISQVVPDS